MEEVERQATSADPLLACCLCRRLLQEAVQLACLHNCCRQCFNTASSTGNSQSVACGSCDTVTRAGQEQPNGFIDSQVLRCKLLAESRMCGKCRENGTYDQPAVVWCTACRHSLCEGCMSLHGQYFRQHVTQSLDEIRSLDKVLSHESLATCQLHKKPMDIACRNCELAKCVTCWAECNAKKHEMHVVGKDSFDSYIEKFVACISTMESELLLKSEVLEKPKSILRDTKAARDRHLEDLKTRKRRVVDAIELVYQEVEFSTKNAYDNLEAEVYAAAAAANRIASDLSDARTYIRRLVESNDKCEILKQQKIVRECLSVLSAKLNTLSDRLSTTIGEVKIEASLPDDLEEIVREWIGKPFVCSGLASSSPRPKKRMQPQQQLGEQKPLEEQQQQTKQQQFLAFGSASAGVQLPVTCKDVALTADGRRLLLAAGPHGLIEFSSLSGRELSRWLPPTRGEYDEDDDEVSLVSAMSDGRAAVSLLHAKLILLLKRREQDEGDASGAVPVAVAAVADDVWTEDRRLGQLPSPVSLLSAHFDVLAMCFQKRGFFFRLRLMSASSGRRLSADLQCEYPYMYNLVVTAGAVVTGGQLIVDKRGIPINNAYDSVYRRMAVLDAYSLAYGQRLWRHEVSNCIVGERTENEVEELQGICADSVGGCLYAAVCRRNRSSGRVFALNLTDGSELRRVVLSFGDAESAPQPLQQLLPFRLSLSEDEVAADEQQQSSSMATSSSSSSSGRRVLLLAVLCCDSATKECRTVMMHRSKCDVPQ